MIEANLSKLKSGIIGEQRLFRMLESYRNHFPYKVVKDVSLDAGGKFQIDCMILTPKLIFILESKNIGGKLYFEKNPERLVRVKENGETSVLESPEIQVERNVALFNWWLEQQGLKIPVVGAFVFTSSTPPLILKGPERVTSLFPKSIFYYLHQKWNEYNDREQCLSKGDIDKLSKIIQIECKKNRFEQYPLRKSWNLDTVQIVNGVRCLKCSRIGMARLYGKWQCPACNHSDKDSHIPTLQEWFIFNKDQITNAECRDYLMITDRHLAKRLLKHENLLEFFSYKSTYYKWKW
ncbi:nuclease-related domain-containing protein [Ureibacillus acetophenoni]|uniref:Nuclease-like protein n=1 Tax=Ureibacillus acetophenoni TaxID=614649 RepID=A0A285U4E5_9BACL|nr:nuclease-related domain-containing protein [Ureibacillus acetophenoni]SOC35141.1 nuclease-like protein [Ureibacillus acetophenoni]